MNAQNRPKYFNKLGFYRKEKIIDADTIIVSNKNGKNGKIRLAYIDAPEIPNYWKKPYEKYQKNCLFYLSQYTWGIKATNHLKNILKNQDKVQLRIIERDRYGRYVAEVYTRDNFLQSQLLTEGLSLIYFSYIEDCSITNAYKLFSNQKSASDSMRNIWSDHWLIYPNLFRLLKRYHESFYKTIETQTDGFKQDAFDALNKRLSVEHNKNYILRARQEIDEFEMWRRFKENCVNLFGDIKWN